MMTKQTFNPGDICRFRKNGSIVRVIREVELSGGYTVERLDNGKQFFATAKGLVLLRTAEAETA
jgi:hypothetical protein